ncbi:labd-13Z-ene-9,15,16-triol synthase, chloroplastic-like [Cornus florida]|uniref:labd-13Z-ene-9,15,16-triol synthase, chloroplastic-like n=1 Tax=Cornus florida TaxID=4283 RepID=UPI0028A1DB49|nr:labd-13Z-ene-9,15,16-triol synthase, chloroplastic-like [Cornus florida]
MNSDLLNEDAQWTWWWKGNNKKDELALYILTVSVVILAIFWYLWASVKSRTGVAPLPPGPRGLPVVGYLPFLGINLHIIFSELAHRYGPIYKLWLGKKLCIVLSSPSLAKEVLRDQDISFANRDVPIAGLAVSYGGLDILWSPYGSYWRNMRKMFVREMMSNANLEACHNLRKEEVRKTIRDVYAKIGKPLDIGKIIFLTEQNVVMSMLWGDTLEGEKNSSVRYEFQEVIQKLVGLGGVPNISDFFPMLAKFDIQGVKRQGKRLLAWVERILDDVIAERMRLDSCVGAGVSKDKERKDFLEILLAMKKEKEDTASPLTLTQIKAMLIDIVAGATDTTATMAEWVMAELMYHPGVMKKVQEELAEVVGMNIVEESHLPKLHYLDAVVKETFRLHPPLPLLVPKTPSKSCTVGGYTIPKNTMVFLNVWALHRDPQVWDDPSEFKPERFFSEPGKWDYTGNNLPYIPFGSGRRICAGLPLAEKMLMDILASLLHSFDWQIPKGEVLELSGKFGIVMRKTTSLLAIPTPRLASLELYA